MGSIEIRRVTAHLGADISGIELDRPLSAAGISELKQALLDYQVLFFHKQNITPEQQVDFARQFGPIHRGAFVPKHGDNPDYIVLDQTKPEGEGADQWHTDNTFMPHPPLGSVLKAVQLPETGGDTCWASMYSAFDGLSQTLQSMLDGLTAIHDITPALQKAIRAGHTASGINLAEVQKQWPPCEHPVVKTHPETGRKALYVHRNSTIKIKELSDRENEVLLPFLCDHIRSPLFQCRLRWNTNTIAFWDNRAVQHYAVPDYNERRVMHRVTIDS